MPHETLTPEGVARKLNDVMVQCILALHSCHEGTYRGRDDKKVPNFFAGKSNEEVMEWVREQAAECGLPSHQVGSSHMYLDSKLFGR